MNARFGLATVALVVATVVVAVTSAAAASLDAPSSALELGLRPVSALTHGHHALRSRVSTTRQRAERGSGGLNNKALRRSARSPFDREWLPSAVATNPTFCYATETFCQNGGYINLANRDCDSWSVSVSVSVTSAYS
jgi:hypothetical protein